MVLLISLSRGSTSKIVLSLIYGISMIFLFLSSSLYHFFKKVENENSIWRKLDHIAIFFMIAGNYTPVSYLLLDGRWKWSIIIAQWILVLGGIFLKFFYLKIPRYLYTMIYLAMGWIGIIAIRQLFMVMNKSEILFLILGGLSYTVGAFFYIIKKPKIKNGFGFHEIFHLFVLLGAFFHYLLIYSIML